jgi:hypothetical protein
MGQNMQLLRTLSLFVVAAFIASPASAVTFSYTTAGCFANSGSCSSFIDAPVERKFFL